MVEVIEVMIEAGMLPADEHDVEWVHERWEGVADAKEEFGCYVVARSTRYQIVAALVNDKGEFKTSVTMQAYDGEVIESVAAAMVAVIKAWSA